MREPEVGDPRPQLRAIQFAEWRLPEPGQRVRAEVLRVASLRARPQVGDGRPPAIAPLGDGDTAEPGVDERALQTIDFDEVHVRLGILSAT